MKDKQAVERVQRVVTILVTGLEDVAHESRLKILEDIGRTFKLLVLLGPDDRLSVKLSARQMVNSSTVIPSHSGGPNILRINLSPTVLPPNTCNVEPGLVDLEPPTETEVRSYISAVERNRAVGLGGLVPAVFTEGWEALLEGSTGQPKRLNQCSTLISAEVELDIESVEWKAAVRLTWAWSAKRLPKVNRVIPTKDELQSWGNPRGSLLELFDLRNWHTYQVGRTWSSLGYRTEDW
ncbi:uncharacterized protein DEA37_0006376 [Paragonimus westermani]|uniref:Uncharacterized protein n=1 Tax=Paragonimus westermani TaxID=34504 RepID=A0A5J4NNR5_9TREM|nr:uncharacterized protein DEA37_0006376 [Paragonimus westermani]